MRPLTTAEIAEITRVADSRHPEGGEAWGRAVAQEAMFRGYQVADTCTCTGHAGDRGHDPLCGYYVPDELDGSIVVESFRNRYDADPS